MVYGVHHLFWCAQVLVHTMFSVYTTTDGVLPKLCIPFDQFHVKLSEVPTYIPNTSSPPFAALFGVACAPLLSALRTCAFPRDSLSSISCRSILNALAVVRSSFVCSVPIFIVYDSHLYDNSCGEIEWMRRIDCNSPRTFWVRSVTGGIAKRSLSSFFGGVHRCCV